MFSSLLSGGGVTVAVITVVGGAVATGIGVAAHSAWETYQDVDRLSRRLEGDNNDDTNPGFFKETNEKLDNIDRRLDAHGHRFDDIDDSLETIAQHLADDLDGDHDETTFVSGRWRDDGNQSESDD